MNDVPSCEFCLDCATSEDNFEVLNFRRALRHCRRLAPWVSVNGKQVVRQDFDVCIPLWLNLGIDHSHDIKELEIGRTLTTLTEIGNHTPHKEPTLGLMMCASGRRMVIQKFSSHTGIIFWLGVEKC
jgi:hypothetical protein